jgi:hypothetical protein
MRLQLILALLFAASVVLFAARAMAQALAKVDARSGIYQDTDRTTVTTTNVAARGSLDHVGVEARYLVDMITSASVDVVSAATTAFHEVRTEVEGGADYHDDVRKLTGSYVHSIENDWESHTGNLGFTQDFAHHDITLKLGATYVANAVGRAHDPNFHRSMQVGGGTAGLTFVLSPDDLLDASYTASYIEGYQASPYRFVAFRGTSGSPIVSNGPEVDPDRRVRHAVTIRWNHHMFTDTALRSHLRGYADDWGIASVTAGTEYVVGFGPIETGLFVRGYAQRHAEFYAAEYDAPMRYMTADRELASFVDGFGGARLAWRQARMGVFEDVHLEAKGTGFAFRFFDFPRLRERTGAIGEIAFGLAF